MSAKFKDRTGEHFTTNEGYEIIIIKYNGCNDVTIQFQDKYKAILEHRQYRECQKGTIKNTYHPSVHGVGCLGLMKDGSKPITSIKSGTHIREYYLWVSMIGRCHSKKVLKERPTYEDVEVCERWLVYSQFLEDLPLIEGYSYWLEHPNERIALDKDIKGNGSKVYCLDNCCFVSLSDNSKELHKRYGTRYFFDKNN